MENKDYAAALSIYQGLEQTAEIKEREYRLAQISYDEGYYVEKVIDSDLLLKLTKLFKEQM